MHCINTEEANDFFQPGLITNCLMYTNLSNTSGNYKCQMCVSGYYPNETKTSCVTSCPNQLLRKYRKSSSGSVVNLSYCVNSAISNCAEVAPLLQPDQATNESTVGCVKCKTGYIRILSAPNSYAGEDYSNLSTSYYTTIEGPTFTCELQNARLFKTTNTTTAPSNCQMYAEYNGKLECRRCAFGYTGIVDTSSSTNLICDTAISGCNTSVKYGGHFQQLLSDPFYTHRFFSCHKCNKDEEIPILFIGTVNYLSFGIEYGV